MKLTEKQRQQIIEREKRKTRFYLGIEEIMSKNYEAIYQADLQAMGGQLSVSKQSYIASLKISDNGNSLPDGFIGSVADAKPGPQDAKLSHGDEKYRRQYRADLAVLGEMSCTEEEYIKSLKVSENGGVHSLH